MEKSLDQKLRAIHADPHGSKEFILADAKDADMALGIGAPARSPERHGDEVKFRSLAEYRALIEQIVAQGFVDIMLMSASTSEVLALHRRIFDGSAVTPAVRVNDTTDIHILRGGRSPVQPSLPFRTATLDHIRCGRVECAAGDGARGPDLGLYSITFNNDAILDRESLERYKEVRLEAERKGFRHFLEVFDPNQPGVVGSEHIPGFVNDAIARALAGVTSAGRPLFLKIVYHGPRALEELVHYDPHLVVGILGGSAGTTYDAFKLLSEARKYGARVALFGRKINHAENQLAFVHFLRLIADGEITAEEAVRAYHAVLGKLGVRPHRRLEEDLQLQTNVMSYAGDGKTLSLPEAAPAPSRKGAGRCACGCSPAGGGKACEGKGASGSTEPDFARMTAAQKIAHHRARWDRILG